MPDSLIFVAIRKAAVNHLKNGGFMDLPRQYTAVNNYGCLSIGDVPGITRVLKTAYRYSRYEFPGFSRPVQTQLTAIDVPGCYVQTAAPVENFFAHWDVWGVEGLIGVNASGVSLDGGNRLDVHFSSTGKIYFKQALESFDKFRGKSVTFGLTGYYGKGDVKVTFSVDVGSAQQTGRAFYSRYFGPYTRMVQPFKLPTNISKFEITVVMEGGKESFASFSGAILALGEYTSDLPFSENPSDKAVPSGMIILWTGDNCPAGYRSVGDETYLLQTIGDPNAFMGDLMNANTVNKQVIGFNRHDHAAGAASERQPSAFDTRGDSFETAPVEVTGAPTRPVKLSTTNQSGNTTIYEGVREMALPMSHTHLMKLGDTTVEPPRIKVRICEKI